MQRVRGSTTTFRTTQGTCHRSLARAVGWVLGSRRCQADRRGWTRLLKCPTYACSATPMKELQARRNLVQPCTAGAPLGRVCHGAGGRPDGIWVCCPMTSAGEAAGAEASPRSRVAAPSGSPLAQSVATLCASAAFSHRCAARRAGLYFQRSGGRMVTVLRAALHRGAMVLPSPWSCRCRTGAFSRCACG